MWTIITKEQAANFARISESYIDDIWYTSILGTIEVLTSWSYLENATNITEDLNGHGSLLLNCRVPINSISSLLIDGISIPLSNLAVSWNNIAFKNQASGIYTYASTYTEFPAGFGNIRVTYNVGGISSLPQSYQNVLPTVMLLCIKEFVAVPRNEGSDSTLKKYRPNYTPLPEETLKHYGIHGKISGIIKTYLPCKIRQT